MTEDSPREIEYLDETYDADVKRVKNSPKETEYLDESYDDDTKAEEKTDS